MGFRFQKRIKLMPGITLNLSKKGVSTSFGVKGARITRGHGKTRVTVGIPGSGLSHTQVVSNKKKRRSAPLPVAQLDHEQRKGWPRPVKLVAVAVGIFLFAMMLAPFMGR